MSLYNIALNNLRRRKGKVLLALLGLLLGIATVVSVYSVVDAMKEEMLRQSVQFGPQVIITPSRGELAFSYGGITLPEVMFDVERLSMEDVAALDGMPNRSKIRAVAPKLLGVAAAAGGHNLVVAGVDITQEFIVKPWLRPEEGLESLPLTGREILVGAKLAALMRVRQGDVLTLAGEEFHVMAVLMESGSPEDEQILMNMETAQSFLNAANEISLIELAVDYSLISEAALLAQLQKVLPGADVKSLRQETLRRDEMLTSLTRFGLSVAALILSAGTLLVFFTMSGAVRERTREIAVFRAIGFRRSHITKIILLEGALISVVGGMLGYMAGYLLGRYGGGLLAGMPIRVLWRFDLLLPALLLALGSGLLASILPARKAANLDPAEALRFI